MRTNSSFVTVVSLLLLIAAVKLMYSEHVILGASMLGIIMLYTLGSSFDIKFFSRK
ncbi:hypothetical protein [Pontibacter sp. SGAir0037]|uniref:hypothetical protein n=1 Tax=Pontibacter sp. SGAir0037 TaxID=2571030 RepID=UPI00143D2BC8|nr:hypothetical protein [Pontibacter sp. SGAir0037]